MGATQEQISWVLTSYIVSTAICMPLTGFLAERFGRRRLFLASVIGFTVASMLCGAAGTLGQLVLFRVLQGAFGAFLVPLAQAWPQARDPRDGQRYADLPAARVALPVVGVLPNAPCAPPAG